MTQKIGLCMIVRDEAHVIERCLKSVLPLISSWTVCDTGSEDNTKEIVRGLLGHLPGEIHDDPWVHFAHNRTVAIKRALERNDADYILVIDADHEWFGRLPELDQDCYLIEHKYGELSYGIPCLMNARKQWRYECPIHETIVGTDTKPTVALDAGHAWVKVYPEGARSRDPNKFKKDAAILLAHVSAHPDEPRPTYYLAQSLRDAAANCVDEAERRSLIEEARKWYGRRMEMNNGWWEEAWHARYRFAQMGEALELDFSVLLSEYLSAYQANPMRAEPLVCLARLARLKDFLGIAAMASRQAMSIAMPPGSCLFVEVPSYKWVAAFEFSIAAWYSGAREEGLRTCQKLLQGALPDNIREAVEQNIGFYKQTPQPQVKAA